jgi:hypothetical protein
MGNLDAPNPKYQQTYDLLPDLAKLRDALKPLSIRHRLRFLYESEELTEDAIAQLLTL